MSAWQGGTYVVGSGRGPGRRLRLLLAGVVAALIVPGTAAPAQAQGRADQWWLDAWKIEEAWAISQGQGVTVAVVDNGVDGTLPNLAGQVLPGPSGDEVNGMHGTSMASAIAGTGKDNGGHGAMGVAPKAKILPVNVENASDAGSSPIDSSDAIRVAADSDAKIINISLGSNLGSTTYQASAVEYALSKGKLVVAAAGNTESRLGTEATYPAAYPGVLGVGGHDRSGTYWSGALSGPWVSLAAPSVDFVGSCRGPSGDEGYCSGSGTSPAAALVSGVAALVWSAHPDWTANQVIKRLIDTANKPYSGPIPSDQIGYGNVSPRKALQSTDPPGPPDINPLIGNRGVPPAQNTPSPSPTPSTADPSTSAPPPATDTPRTEPAPPSAADNTAQAVTKDDSSDNTLVIVAVVAVGVALLVALTFVVFRIRRNSNTQPPPANYL